MSEGGRGELRPARGASAHGPDCACTRCVGFQPANQLARRHGAYSSVGLAELVERIGAAVREHAPAYEPDVDDYTIDLYALAVARIEIGKLALERADAAGERLEGVEQSVRQWGGLQRRVGNDLGLSFGARARIARDAGLVKSGLESATERRLREHVALKRGEGGRGGSGG